MKITKKAEMSMALIVAIVIGLIILAIVIYMFTSKAKALNTSTSCLPEECSANPTVKFDCSGMAGGGYTRSFTACKYEKKTGFCCVKDNL